MQSGNVREGGEKMRRAGVRTSYKQGNARRNVKVKRKQNRSR